MAKAKKAKKAVKKLSAKSKVSSKVKQKPKLKVTSKSKLKSVVKTKTKVTVKAKTKSKVKVKVAAKVKTKAVVKAKTKVPSKVKAVQKVLPQKVTLKKESVKKIIDYSKAITPLGDRLVVRLMQQERVTPGGLILLESTNLNAGYLKAEVLAAGHGTYSKKGHQRLLDVKVGDLVLFTEDAGQKVEFNQEELHIINETDIFGVL